MWTGIWKQKEFAVLYLRTTALNRNVYALVSTTFISGILRRNGFPQAVCYSLLDKMCLACGQCIVNLKCPTCPRFYFSWWTFPSLATQKLQTAANIRAVLLFTAWAHSACFRRISVVNWSRFNNSHSSLGCQQILTYLALNSILRRSVTQLCKESQVAFFEGRQRKQTILFKRSCVFLTAKDDRLAIWNNVSPHRSEYAHRAYSNSSKHR